MGDTPVHIVVPTHTSRHLDLALAGLARQATPAATVIVACDGDDPAIGAIVQSWAPRLPSGASWVRRAHTGAERLCQTRNNGVRHLVGALGIRTGRLLIIDGDMVLHREALARHASLGARAALVLPYRINLGEAPTAALDAEAVARNEALVEPTDAERRELGARDARYRKHLVLRRLRIGAMHKPKLLGGHFSRDLALYLRLNGFDEEYQGWGFKDDEFAYRSARVGARGVPACAAIPAWHLWHPTRQPPGPMRDLPTAHRFAMRARLPVVCARGVENPLPQPQVQATQFGGGGGADTM